MTMLIDPVSPGPFGAATRASLHDELNAALDGRSARALVSCANRRPNDEADELRCLLELHDLWMAPLERLDGRERWQFDSSVAVMRSSFEQRLLERLAPRARRCADDLPSGVAGMRRVARLDMVPEVYRWLAEEASWTELISFLALEGGPDAGFDDLVATAQVGVRGIAKVALGANYWDEMGTGDPDEVHTELHAQMVRSIRMPQVSRAELPAPALERMALNGVLAINRSLQPELIGALGLLELQAGPRCRAVVAAMERLGADEHATRFYRVHAETDPLHGRDWLDRVVEPLSEQPGWARRMVEGAVLRHVVNQRFFSDVARRLQALRC